MLLTCPTCRSGLAVPDGTTAMVRCPACKSVFSPADGLAPPEPETEEEKPKKKPARKARDEDEDEDEKPRKKKPAGRDDEKARNRDFDPVDPEEEKRRRKKRRREEDEKLSPEEREAVKRAFARASIGAKLIWISFALFLMSMGCIIAFWFQAAFPSLEVSPAPVVLAGVMGAIGWMLAAVGVGLCLSGPPSPGHWGYGISAASFTVIHLVLVVAVASKGTDYSAGSVVDKGGPAAHWGLVPTRLDAVTYYLTVLIYKDQEIVPKGELNLSIVVGIAEILRTTLVLMLLSCLAQSAGDKELSHKCTRAAGFASFGPGFMALGMLLFVVLITESRAGVTNMTKVMFSSILMGTYAIINGCMFPGFMAAREVDDACAEPFQSQIPQL